MAKPRTALEPVTTASLGELLRYFRERANLSQRELAQKVGYHYSYISRLEKNERALSESVLRKLFIPALKLEHDSKATTRLLELATSINLSAAITDSDLQPASSPARSAGLRAAFIGAKRSADQKPDLIISNSLSIRSRIWVGIGVCARSVVSIGFTSAATNCSIGISFIAASLAEA